MKYDRHAEKKNFYKKVEDRVNEKLAEYEANIEKRRDKYLSIQLKIHLGFFKYFYFRLREILDLEERELYKEIVDNAQRGNESRLDEMRQRLQEIHAKREKEREDLVRQKRIQQYL